ncbi:transporter substrate-binding domain-containing protein [Lacibacterium aquatile]|uniref:Transporter substrate-binding domain-containing protein n=1 Tax=Lacibacterium aquatile TaxID=1168082 RepID=A0ABW5DQX8_9PROT
MKSVFLAALLASSALPAAALTFTTEDFPPFSLHREGQVAGINSDILRLAAEKAGLSVDFRLLPWPRWPTSVAARSAAIMGPPMATSWKRRGSRSTVPSTIAATS